MLERGDVDNEGTSQKTGREPDDGVGFSRVNRRTGPDQVIRRATAKPQVRRIEGHSAEQNKAVSGKR